MLNRMETDDCELVHRARAGDREAFDALTVRYWQRCVGIALIYLRNREDAEEQVQNSFFKAYLHLQSCDAAKFRSWLDKITENECRMFRRNRQRRPWPLMHFGLRSRIASREPGPEKQAMREELVRLVRREVAGLPVLFRETVRLHRLEELGIDQVAQRIVLQVPAAKSRLVRGQQELRDRLRRAGVTP